MSAETDLTDPRVLRAAARAAGLRPQHHLGQNFLVDSRALDQILDALDPGPAHQVLEIGPGVGTLTGALAARAGRVVAVDIDQRCVSATRATQASRTNVEVVHGDALRVDPPALGLPAEWLVAGNIPYNITTPLLGYLFEMPRPPRRGVFLVQREVAARLAAVAGGWSLATLVVRSLAGVERIADVPPESFEPPPAVHSSIIRLIPSAQLEPAVRERALTIARAAFQMRRKTMRHGITNAAGGDESTGLAWLAAAGIDPGRRPGTLDVAEWGRIAGAAATLPAHA